MCVGNVLQAKNGDFANFLDKNKNFDKSACILLIFCYNMAQI